jgi:membrane-associated protease RseP (regulator of RpoE activity)
MRTLHRSGPALALSLAFAACSTTPVGPVPLPLPETLAWATEESADAGAFLGLKTRENLSGGFEDLDFQSGLYVTRVVENSPAAEVGCRVGDVLLSFGGHATDDPETLATLLRSGVAGQEVVLEVQRGDTVFEVPVELGAAAGGDADADVRESYLLDPARSRAAWATGRGGAVLVASADDAPFPRAGVPVGSAVLSVEGEEVLSARALIRALERHDPGATVRVELLDAAGNTDAERVRLHERPSRLTRFSLPVLVTYDADVDGEETSFVLLDLWFISLFRYQRVGAEKRWRFLRFIELSTGVGELTD